MDFENTTAIVTGGASGLGRATVEALAGKGSNIAIFDRDREKGEALAGQLDSPSIFCEVNVADDAAIGAGINATMAAFGAIHVCVNCAGRGGGATKTLGRSGRFPMDRSIHF